jgi:hypothetical protein
MVTPSSSSITTAQPLTVTVAVSGGAGIPIPAGTVTLTSGSYTSPAATLSGGKATIEVPAGSLAVGNDIHSRNLLIQSRCGSLSTIHRFTGIGAHGNRWSVWSTWKAYQTFWPRCDYDNVTNRV